MKTLNEIIGEQIRTRRKAIGMKQGELADRLGMCVQNSVSQWERGKFCPSLIYLCDLADVFGCSVDELLGRNEMTRVLCAAVECAHNKDNRCTKKEIALRQGRINTVYEGHKTMWECKKYELSDEFKELVEKFRRHVSESGQKDRMV